MDMEILNRRRELTRYANFPSWSPTQSKREPIEERRGMIPDRDIWRAANLLIREHGADAEIVAARRADEMLERIDRDGQLVWHRIRHAIVQLQAVPVGTPN
jgi:hypothetical protein